MFTIEGRDRVRDTILKIARADPRVAAGAMIGSFALSQGDRWSDLDLGFGLADGASPGDILAQWTLELEREFDAVHFFDLPSLSTIYRIFLFPGCLQVDVSMTPAPSSEPRTEVQSALRPCRRTASYCAAAGGASIRVGRSPRGTRAILRGSRPILAGPVLDRRGPQLSCVFARAATGLADLIHEVTLDLCLPFRIGRSRCKVAVDPFVGSNSSNKLIDNGDDRFLPPPNGRITISLARL